MPSETLAAPTGTVHFERKIQVRDYESALASIFMQFDIDPSDIDATLTNAKDAFAQCKALVFEELGLAFKLDEGGYVRELLESKFGTVTEVRADEAHAARPATSSSRGGRGGGNGSDRPARSASSSGGGNRPIHIDNIEDCPDWLDVCEDCDGVEFFDNRTKIESGEWKRTSPHFKCARKDCGKAVWPPKRGGR